MAYTTDDNVREYINAGGSSIFGTDVIGTRVMADKISSGDSMIDLKLSKRYTVPFTTTPPVIQTISNAFSGWFALRSVYTNEIPSALQFVEDDYKKAMEWLEDLKNKEVDLPASGGGIVTEKGSDTLMYSSNKDYFPIFDVDNELNQSVSSERLEDIAGERE